MRTKMFRNAFPGSVILIALLALPACSAPGPSGADTSPHSDAEKVEIVLPMGKAEAGKQAFVDLGCTSCHIVSGVEGLPQPVSSETVDLAVSVRGLSRSAIVTSIITPDHVDSQSTELWTEWSQGQRVWLGPAQRVTEAEEASKRTISRMASYSAVMTVEQLSDLAAFVGSVASQG